MADEREQSGVAGSSGRDQLQTDGREANAAQPLDAGSDNGGAERYPSVRQDDAVERTGRSAEVTGNERGFQAGEARSFDPAADAKTPEPRPATTDGDVPASANDGRLGPGADPAEGKR